MDDLDDDNMGERHTAHTLQSPQHLDLEDSGVTTVNDGLLFRFVEYDGVTDVISLCFLEGVLRTTESSADIAFSITSVSSVSETCRVSEVRGRTGGGMLVIGSVECCDCDTFDAIFTGQ